MTASAGDINFQRETVHFFFAIVCLDLEEAFDFIQIFSNFFHRGIGHSVFRKFKDIAFVFGDFFDMGCGVKPDF